MLQTIKTVAEKAKQALPPGSPDDACRRIPHHQPLLSARSVSKADCTPYPLPRPIQPSKSGSDTVLPVRRAECHDMYLRVVAQLSDKVRVVECRDRIQWIVQRRRSVCPNSWRGYAFCRTKEALLRRAGSGDPGAMAWLHALPECFPTHQIR
jgi:hypothetical protein